MATKPADKKIYLASKSPRRRELLRQIGIDFELLLLRADGPRGADVTEAVLPGEAPLDYVARVALEKAVFAHALLKRRHLTPRPVLTADIVAREHEAIHRLSRAAEFRDADTGFHLSRMAAYSHLIAVQLGVCAAEAALSSVSVL